MPPAEDLIALQARARLCRKCLDAGYEIYPRAIFSGAWGARMMIIGQAPGITEQAAGRPFNAGSGKRLFTWLAAAGIDEAWFRATQYITSVTKCYPGRAKGGGGDRVPSTVERDLCRPYLEGEIALVNPEVILPVGRLAVEQFFPKSAPLTGLIGTEELIGGRWVIPLPHPSGASRWHQSEDNRRKIDRAVERIGVHYARLFPGR